MTDATPLRTLPRNARGSVLASFGLLAPAFLLLVLAVFEYGLYLFVGGNLESAVREASRFGATGAEGAGLGRTERILQIVEERTLGMLKPGAATVRIETFPSFASISAGGGSSGAGGPGDVVLYQIEYAWSPITPMFEPLLGSAVLSTSVAIRNEVF